MDYYLIFGMVAVAMIAFIGFTTSVKNESKKEQSLFQELNISITQLNDEIRRMNETTARNEKRIEKHGQQIDELDKRVCEIDNRVSLSDLKILSIEKAIDKA